jgi:hypothetical protein
MSVLGLYCLCRLILNNTKGRNRVRGDDRNQQDQRESWVPSPYREWDEKFIKEAIEIYIRPKVIQRPPESPDYPRLKSRKFILGPWSGLC